MLLWILFLILQTGTMPTDRTKTIYFIQQGWYYKNRELYNIPMYMYMYISAVLQLVTVNKLKLPNFHFS